MSFKYCSTGCMTSPASSGMPSSIPINTANGMRYILLYPAYQRDAGLSVQTVECAQVYGYQITHNAALITVAQTKKACYGLAHEHLNLLRVTVRGAGMAAENVEARFLSDGAMIILR